MRMPRWMVGMVGFVLAAGMILSSGTLVQADDGDHMDDGIELSEVRTQYRETVASVDQRIQTEVVRNDVRIGVAFGDPEPFYRDGEPIFDDAAEGQLLRVWLREDRTKRYLPKSTVTATVLDGDGNVIAEHQLQEVWDGFHGYVTQVEVPDQAASVEVNASAPNLGRHAEMRNRHRSAVEATFELEDTDPARFVAGEIAGTGDYELGSDLELALGESVGVKAAGPYLIGFIAEGSEPYWVPASMNGDLELSPADISEDANRHVEAVVVDRRSGQLLPLAGIELVFRHGKSTVRTVSLPFLLAEFYHYGHSIELQPRNYFVGVTVTPPPLATPEDVTFSEQTVEFPWNGQAGGEHSHD